MDIATRRLRSQRLADNPLETADEVVGWLGAVQAQDYPAAVWALGQRTRDATAADVHRLFDAGTIVRTHVLRPTWHFALAADVRWLLALTAPRLRTALAGRWRELGIDPGVMRSAQDAFAHALAGGRQLTRTELGAVLQAAGIAPDGQRLPHLILAAELDALVLPQPGAGTAPGLRLVGRHHPGRCSEGCRRGGWQPGIRGDRRQAVLGRRSRL